ncbi:hypothetical protein M1466_00965 [Candidatus Dependentiae bacterium]|nr:hypothetical protein [Candidatus Dependentiae bacterium]
MRSIKRKIRFFCCMAITFIASNSMAWYGKQPTEFTSNTLYGIPYLGAYNPEQYAWRELLTGATMNIAQLKTAPKIVLQELKNIIGEPTISMQQLVEKLHERGIRTWYTIVWGGPIFGETADRTYNIAMHPVVAAWRNAKPGQWFNETIGAGIFAPIGVSGAQQDSIAINRLADVAVSYHEPADFSPNNARIVISDNTEQASFWLIATKENDLHVSHHFVAKSKAQEQELNIMLQVATVL